METAKKLEQQIMRRVYYSYTISFFLLPMFWRGVLLGAAIALFGRLTHVAALVHNFLSVPIGNVPQYVWNSVSGALSHGEVLTVLVTLFIFFSVVSLFVRLLPLVGGGKRLAI